MTHSKQFENDNDFPLFLCEIEIVFARGAPLDMAV